MKYLKKLNESPDEILFRSSSNSIISKSNIKNGDLKLSPDYGIAFGYPKFKVDIDKVEISRLSYDEDSNMFVYPEGNHPLMQRYSHHIDNWSWATANNAAIDSFEFSGRLWKDYKVISFWVYPENKQHLDKIINDLNKILNINVDGDWLIEVYEDIESTDDMDRFKKDEIHNRDFGHGEEKWKNHLSDRNLIKIKDYKKSENPSEEEYNLHLMRMKDKVKIMMDGGYRAKQPTWPRHLMPFESYNESKKTKRFSLEVNHSLVEFLNAKFKFNDFVRTYKNQIFYFIYLFNGQPVKWQNGVSYIKDKNGVFSIDSKINNQNFDSTGIVSPKNVVMRPDSNFELIYNAAQDLIEEENCMYRWFQDMGELAFESNGVYVWDYLLKRFNQTFKYKNPTEI